MAKSENAFSRLRKLVRLEAKLPPEPEVLQNSPRPMVGLFSTLSESQKAKALSLEENVNFGEEDFLLGGKRSA